MQHVDLHQMQVLAAGIVVVALSVRQPVDVALVVTVASLMCRVVALPVEALLTSKLRHQPEPAAMLSGCVVPEPCHA